MLARGILALTLGLALTTSAAQAKERGCSGKLSGAVKGSFSCKVKARAKGSGAILLTVSPAKLPKSVKAFAPAEVELPVPVEKKEYTLATLKSGRTLLTTSGHKTFVAEKGKEQKGDLTLSIETLETGEAHSVASLGGTLKARLVPAAGGGGEVVVDLRF
ncbi:MAG TPA: hypothetical protein VF904_03035 [Anaeromyxobacteraceae bacterium]